MSDVQLLGMREKLDKNCNREQENGSERAAINGIFVRFNTLHGLRRQLGRAKLDEITHS